MALTTGHPYTLIPALFVDAATAYEPVGGSTIASELPLFAVHLQAENKAAPPCRSGLAQPGNSTPTLPTTACPPKCGPFAEST